MRPSYFSLAETPLPEKLGQPAKKSNNSFVKRKKRDGKQTSGAWGSMEDVFKKDFPNNSGFPNNSVFPNKKDASKKQPRRASVGCALAAKERRETVRRGSAHSFQPFFAEKVIADVLEIPDGKATDEGQTGKSLLNLKPMKLQFWKTKMCPWLASAGHCRKGQACRYAHKIDELRPLPDLSKTKMCDEFLSTRKCSLRHACKYAHSIEELRATTSFSKTKICPLWLKGDCSSGLLCRFAHGSEELKSPPAAPLEGDCKETDFPDNRDSSCLLPVTLSPPQHSSAYSLPSPQFLSSEQISSGDLAVFFQGLSPSSLQYAANALLYLGDQQRDPLGFSPLPVASPPNVIPCRLHLSPHKTSAVVDQVYSPSVCSPWDPPLQMDAKLFSQYFQAPQAELRSGPPTETFDANRFFTTHLLPSGMFSPMTQRASPQRVAAELVVPPFPCEGDNRDEQTARLLVGSSQPRGPYSSEPRNAEPLQFALSPMQFLSAPVHFVPRETGMFGNHPRVLSSISYQQGLHSPPRSNAGSPAFNCQQTASFYGGAFAGAARPDHGPPCSRSLEWQNNDPPPALPYQRADQERSIESQVDSGD